VSGVLVDTNVLIDCLRDIPRAVKYVETSPGHMSISALTVAELYAGAREPILTSTPTADVLQTNRTCDSSSHSVTPAPPQLGFQTAHFPRFPTCLPHCVTSGAVGRDDAGLPQPQPVRRGPQPGGRRTNAPDRGMLASASDWEPGRWEVPAVVLATDRHAALEMSVLLLTRATGSLPQAGGGFALDKVVVEPCGVFVRSGPSISQSQRRLRRVFPGLLRADAYDRHGGV